MKKMTRQLSLFGLSLIVGLASTMALAEPELYETGPGEETAYVRFVNATDQAVSISSSKGAAKIALGAKAAERASRFYKVSAGAKLTAMVQSGKQKTSVEVTGKPWEYITIAVLPNGAGQVKTRLVREMPTDFNAMRASLALFNLDPSCANAMMQGGAKKATILSEVAPLTVQRRLVNPIKLAVAVSCGKSPDVLVDLAQLQAGERYSVFLFSLKNIPQAVFAVDAN